MRLGFGEILVVLLADLVVLGPEKLPYYARKCGGALAAFRKSYREAAQELSAEKEGET